MRGASNGAADALSRMFGKNSKRIPPAYLPYPTVPAVRTVAPAGDTATTVILAHTLVQKLG